MSGQDPTGFLPYDPQANVADQVCESFINSLRYLHPDATIPNVRSLLAKYAVRAKRDTEEREEAPLQEVYLDSYVMHSPMNNLQSTLQAWAVMEALVDAGLVRYIGFSSMYLSCSR